MPRTIRTLVLASLLLLAACDTAQPPGPPPGAPTGPPPGAPTAPPTAAPTAPLAAMTPAAPMLAAPAAIAPEPLAARAGGRLPYARIEAIVQAAAPGEIVEVELEQVDADDGYGPATAIYEIKVLAASGRVLELEIDATTGQILKQETE